MQYQDVPKDRQANLDFRIALIRDCLTQPKLARAVKQLCRQDILFWTNTFLFTYDPRKIKLGLIPDLPFITWEFQDKTILTIKEHYGKRNIGIEKARDMGASWMCLVVLLHEWQFFRGRANMLVSRNQDLVDKAGDPDTLFWKVDYLISHQPEFLISEDDTTRNELMLVNHTNGSTMRGAATTGDVGRGGRQSSIMLDEFGAFKVADSHDASAATANNTECRIFNSTYKGCVGAFYDQMQRKDTYPEEEDGIVKISLPWQLHPEHAAGLYKDNNGKERSPWYDKKCKELVVQAKIACELDMDPQGAASPFFPVQLISSLIDRHARPPVMRGRMTFDEGAPSKCQFIEDNTGHLLLWSLLSQPFLKPEPYDQFVIGADVSQGTEASNSVLSVANKKTREKVAELATRSLNVHKFANLAVAVAWWFNEAFFIWENNGPGSAFGKRVVEVGYTNIYFRQDEMGLTHKITKSMVPGWNSSPQNKELLFQDYIRCLASGHFINRSTDALNECRQIVYLPGGSVGNNMARDTTDPSASGKNHGDRPTADALCCKALGPEPDVATPEAKAADDPLGYDMVDPPYMSLAWRRQEWQRAQRSQEDGWGAQENERRGWFSPAETKW